MKYGQGMSINTRKYIKDDFENFRNWQLNLKGLENWKKSWVMEFEKLKRVRTLCRERNDGVGRNRERSQRQC